MLGTEPEVPTPLATIDQIGYTVGLAQHFWEAYGVPTAVSGDPVR